MDSYYCRRVELHMREGGFYVFRGGELRPIPDPVEIEAETLIDHLSAAFLGAETVETIIDGRLSGKLRELLPRFWRREKREEGLAGTVYRARLLILPPEK